MLTYDRVFLCLEIRLCFWRGSRALQSATSGVYSTTDKHFLGRNAELHWCFSMSKTCFTDLSSWSMFAQQSWNIPNGLIIQGPEALSPPVSEWPLNTLELHRIVQNLPVPLKLNFQAEKKMRLRKYRHMVAINHRALQNGDTKQKKKGKLNVLQDVAN